MAIVSKEVAEAIKRNSRIFEGIIAVGDALEQIGSLDQALAESQARLAASKAAEVDSQASVDGLSASIKLLTGKKSDAVVNSNAIVSAANDKAAQILADTKLVADGVLAQAKSSAELIVADAEAKATGLAVSINAQSAVLDAIYTEIDNASKEKGALQKAIDSIKSKFA